MPLAPSRAAWQTRSEIATQQRADVVGSRFVNVNALTPEERERWAELAPEQRAFVTEREPLWRRAHEIAANHPGVDVSDVYHVLVTWHETPSQRLQRSLRRARLLARAR